MAYRPPKGVKPPQLEGKRTGRPRGSRNLARAWRDFVWGFTFRYEDWVKPPNAAAEMFRRFARWYPDEVEAWLVAGGQLPPPPRPEGLEAMLQDMKWVIRHNAEADHTEAHRNWRRLLDEDLKRFFRLLTRLELLRLKTRFRRR